MPENSRVYKTIVKTYRVWYDDIRMGKKVRLCFGITLGLLILGSIFCHNVFADCGDVETSVIDCPTIGMETSRYLAMDIVNILSVGIGIVGVIGITLFGIRVLTARDNQAQIAEARKRFFQIFFGLVVYLLMWTGINWLLPGGVIYGRIEAESIMISPSVKEIVLGQTGKLTVVFFPLNADSQVVEWESSDPKVATIDESGNVNGISIGESTITATAANGLSYQSTVRIVAGYDETVIDSGSEASDASDSSDSGGSDGERKIASSKADAIFKGPYNNYCSDQVIFPGKKYNLTEGQISKIARRVEHEDCANLLSCRFLASQIINLYEYRFNHNHKEARGKTFWEWFKATGWYRTGYYGLTNAKMKRSVKAVIDVIVEGNRVLPAGVAGFDTLELNYPGHKYNIVGFYNEKGKRLDLTKATVNQLIPGKTILTRRGASSKKFWCITTRSSKKHPYGTAYTFGD